MADRYILQFINNFSNRVLYGRAHPASPVVLDPFRLKDVKGGQLRWVKMMDDKLPPDALIGGFENEPLYIIRAQHGRSMCPGKYIASKNKASIPWGHIEHQKKDFEASIHKTIF
ncbi:jg24705 [Pararge aegeria aegeria]|uniref:Jg24705 protein n=1 Tax=Pararge aegeria aegeria TaxID=348720 RepID=A0A8S4QGY8_9NEOP|nr:jg24705 [Pararge aegeria aegeria]